MLTIIVPETESFDPVTERFIYTKEQKLTLEHSLLSIAKWEAKWKKVFFSRDEKDKKTREESRDYIKCMTITQNVDPNVYLALTEQNYKDILEYMQDPMTATWFKSNNKPPSREVITAEVVYYYMVALQIPFSCEKWHFNRLMTLVRVCNEKNKPPKMMKTSAIMSRNHALNLARRKQWNTTG